MPAGDDMDVQVRHALTHPVVDRHKTPLGAKRALDRSGQQSGIPEEWRDQRGRKIRQRLVVPSRNQEGVAWEEGAVVEKGERQGVFKHDVSLGFAALNFTKEALPWLSPDHRANVGCRISDFGPREAVQLTSDI